MDKAPDAFRTISEVAEDLDVPQHVLRFWETRFSQIRPMKRGGGRRYYRPDDLDLLRGIRHLLYGEGYTIRGVQRILREQGVKFVQSVWQAGAAQPARNPADESEDDEAAAESKSARGSRGLFGLLSSRRAADSEEAGEADDGEAADEDEPDDAGEADDEADDSDETDEQEDGDEAEEAEEEADDEPVAAPRREPPRLTAERPTSSARIEPSFAPQSAAPVAPTPPPAPAAIALSREDLRKLQASLHELGECRRLLDQAMDEANNP